MNKKKHIVIRIIWIIMQFALGIAGIIVFSMKHTLAALAAAIWLIGGLRDTYNLVKETDGEESEKIK